MTSFNRTRLILKGRPASEYSVEELEWFRQYFRRQCFEIKKRIRKLPRVERKAGVTDDHQLYEVYAAAIFDIDKELEDKIGVFLL